jgi:hypothetical protein
MIDGKNLKVMLRESYDWERKCKIRTNTKFEIPAN